VRGRRDQIQSTEDVSCAGSATIGRFGGSPMALQWPLPLAGHPRCLNLSLLGHRTPLLGLLAEGEARGLHCCSKRRATRHMRRRHGHGRCRMKGCCRASTRVMKKLKLACVITCKQRFLGRPQRKGTANNMSKWWPMRFGEAPSSSQSAVCLHCGRHRSPHLVVHHTKRARVSPPLQPWLVHSNTRRPQQCMRRTDRARGCASPRTVRGGHHHE
jgi:hypothetical protein